MDLKQFMAIPGEKPLDHLVEDGGFCKIFREIGCIGDSLASGEFESFCPQSGTAFHDMYEYSWGQVMARTLGSKVHSFSRGGMTAKEYMDSYAHQNNFWEKGKHCQAYILALGVNDIMNQGQELGSMADVNPENKYENKDTFAGNYAKIIQVLKGIQPEAKFFLMTMPKSEDAERNKKREAHASLLHAMADFFDNTYVIDLYAHAPVYDEAFNKEFFMGGHMNPSGYVLTAKMVMSYIDYIIRHHQKDFAQVGFIGTPYRNDRAR